MLRTLAASLALFTLMFVGAIVTSPAHAQVSDSPPVVSSVVANTVSTQDDSAQAATIQTVSAKPDSGWSGKFGAWNKYPCQTFGQTCSDHPVGQGDLNYRFGEFSIGNLSGGAFASFLGAGKLAIEVDTRFRDDFKVTLPLIGKVNAAAQVGYDFFNPDGRFGAVENNMFDFELSASQTYPVATWRGITFELTPSVLTMYYLGVSHAAFANYCGANGQLTGTARMDKFSVSVMGGKVLVCQGPYAEPWQSTISASYAFNEHHSLTFVWKWARAANQPETSGFGLEWGFHL